MIALCYCQVD